MTPHVRSRRKRSTVMTEEQREYRRALQESMERRGQGRD